MRVLLVEEDRKAARLVSMGLHEAGFLVDIAHSAVTRPIVLTIGDLSLDPVSHVVTRAGTPINLTPKEYAILEVLMRQPGEVLTRASLGERLWRDDDDVNNLVDVHVSHLRKKIDRPPLEPLIHTVWGRGYRLGPAP